MIENIFLKQVDKEAIGLSRVQNFFYLRIICLYQICQFNFLINSHYWH